MGLPAQGRRFVATRPTRFADLSPGGRLRLDAVARYLQDVSSDDTADSGLEDDLAWVVRKLAIEVRHLPRFREVLTLTTWCSGTGSRWAERRVSITGKHGAAIEAGVLWVHIDVATGRPIPLTPDFWSCYESSTQGRRVGVRLRHPPPPAEATPLAWSWRFCDFDLLGHVNNAAYLVAVEEVLATRRHLRPPLRVEVEYRDPVTRDRPVVLRVHDEPGAGVALWLVDPAGGAVLASARVTAGSLASPRSRDHGETSSDSV